MSCVGTNHSGYNSQCNIIEFPVTDISFKKCCDLFKLPEALLSRSLGVIDPLLMHFLCALRFRSVCPLQPKIERAVPHPAAHTISHYANLRV